MSKTYTAPKLTTHGNVSQITLQSQDSSRSDVLIGTNGQTLSTGLGSIDACLSQNLAVCTRR